MISLIWAMDENRVIGYQNQLPWRIPAELQYFKKVTMGHPIAMGRKTFESIGKVLPGRENIIITRNKEYEQENCTVFHSLADFTDYAKQQTEEIFIIGGAEIFQHLFPIADRLYITKIHHSFTGDTFFPDFSLEDWTLIKQEPGQKDEKNPYNYEFLVYEKK